MATVLDVSIKSLFEPIDNAEVEGYIKVKGKIYQPVGGIKLIKDLCIKSCAYY